MFWRINPRSFQVFTREVHTVDWNTNGQSMGSYRDFTGLHDCPMCTWGTLSGSLHLSVFHIQGCNTATYHAGVFDDNQRISGILQSFCVFCAYSCCVHKGFQGLHQMAESKNAIAVLNLWHLQFLQTLEWQAYGFMRPIWLGMKEGWYGNHLSLMWTAGHMDKYLKNAGFYHKHGLN